MNVRPIGLFALGAALGATACQKIKDQIGASAGSGSSSSSPASAQPVASVAPSATTREASDRFKCPFPKRCDPACKAAFHKTTEACNKESDAMIAAMGKEAAESFGKCNANCVAHNDSCVGSATDAECRCAENCQKNLSAAVKATFGPYEQCIASVVKACQ